MITAENLANIFEKLCPLGLSEACKARGMHDNSGLIIGMHSEIQKILFTMDLSERSVAEAVRLGCDTVVTHHPAIYNPILALRDEDCVQRALLAAVKGGLNVYSMHLNLDIAKGGIEDCLVDGLGGANAKTLEKITDNEGFGREFETNCTFAEFVSRAAQTFKTHKTLAYGDGNSAVKKVASFCGGAAGSAAAYTGDADTVVTSDMPHHIITEITSRGQKVLLLTHYAAECRGMEYFCINVRRLLDGSAETYFYTDSRFM